MRWSKEAGGESLVCVWGGASGAWRSGLPPLCLTWVPGDKSLLQSVPTLASQAVGCKDRVVRGLSQVWTGGLLPRTHP